MQFKKTFCVWLVAVVGVGVVDGELFGGAVGAQKKIGFDDKILRIIGDSLLVGFSNSNTFVFVFGGCGGNPFLPY